MAASPENSAKKALLQVLNKSGDSYDDGDYSFYTDTDSPKSHDPLMNVEVLGSDLRLLSRPALQSTLQTHSLDPGMERMKHRDLHSSKSNEMLDSILNSEPDQTLLSKPRDTKRKLKDKRSNSVTGMAPVRTRQAGVPPAPPPAPPLLASANDKKTHQRSMSDFGMGHSAVESGPTSSPGESLSSSLPGHPGMFT